MNGPNEGVGIWVYIRSLLASELQVQHIALAQSNHKKRDPKLSFVDYSTCCTAPHLIQDVHCPCSNSREQWNKVMSGLFSGSLVLHRSQLISIDHDRSAVLNHSVNWVPAPNVHTVPESYSVLAMK